MCCRKTLFFKKTKKDFAIDHALDDLDNCFEISQIIRNVREFELLKYIIFDKKQRLLFLLPSLNVNIFDENRPNLEEARLDEFEQKLGMELIEKLQELDFDSYTNRKIVKNFIRSIV